MSELVATDVPLLSVLFALNADGDVSLTPSRYLDASVQARFLRACDGARYDYASRTSTARLDQVAAIVRRLRTEDFGVEIAADVEGALANLEASAWAAEQMTVERLARISRQMQEETGDPLYAHQHIGARWMAARRTGHLGDDPGTGKTRTAIASLPTSVPVMILCPASVKGFWAGELVHGRSDYQVTKLTSRDHFHLPKPGEAVIASWELLPDGHGASCRGTKGRDRCTGCASYLREVAPETVLLVDEAHKLKDERTQRTSRAMALAHTIRKRKGRTFVITATALPNRPPELWAVYQVADIAREAFGDFTNFVRLFGGKEKRIRVGKGSGARNVRKYVWDPDAVDPTVPDKLARVSLRRTRGEVLPDLPTKVFREMLVDVDEKALKAIERALEEAGVDVDAVVEALRSDKKTGFRDIARVRALLASAKIPAMLELVETLEEEEQPLVVCSAHRAPIDVFEEREGWATITGDTPSARRTEVVERFQTCSRCAEDVSRHGDKVRCPDGAGVFASDLRGVAVTIQAGGLGITLTRAHQMLQVDQSWVPAENLQMHDRICRIGQDRGVVVTILTARHKLDERVNAVLLEKIRMQAKTTDLSTKRARA